MVATLQISVTMLGMQAISNSGTLVTRLGILLTININICLLITVLPFSNLLQANDSLCH